MAVLYDRDGHADAPAILTCDFKAKELKTGRNEIGRVLHIDGDVATVRLTDDDEGRALGAMLVETIDGTYPDWRRVVPSPDSVSKDNAWGEVGYNMRYLNLIHSAFAALGYKDRVLNILPGKMNGPAVVSPPVEVRDDALFIIMPAKVESYGIPDWTALPEESEAKK